MQQPILAAQGDKWRPEALSVAVTEAERCFGRDFLLRFFQGVLHAASRTTKE